MSFLSNLQNASKWNIGFCNTTPEELVKLKKLGKIQWMRHPFKDRFFADPFIMEVTDTEIIVFVEEYVFANPPGLIVELVLDKKTKRLKQRYELLRLPTHLSYPAFIRVGGEVYVYPENGASGKLDLYRYDAKTHKLVEPRRILDEAVADSTVYKKNDGTYLLTATKFPDNQECVFAFETNSLNSLFKQYTTRPFNTSSRCSRPAGNMIEVDGKVYRPAQDCEERYGAAISVMEFDPVTYQETISFVLKPSYYAYSLGLHTINFHQDICVIDGYGYMYPTLGRIYASKRIVFIRNIAKRILKVLYHNR